MSPPLEVFWCDDASNQSAEQCRHQLLTISDNFICPQERDAFTVVLSGGSLLKALNHLVGAPGVDFSKWHVFFVDERNVPHSHPDSNYKGADEALLCKVCIRNSLQTGD